MLTYDDPVEMFVKKEPTVNKFVIDKAGNLGFTFSKPMVWPANWVAMHERYLAKQAAIAAREAKLNGGRRLKGKKGRRNLKARSQMRRLIEYFWPPEEPVPYSSKGRKLGNVTPFVKL